MSAKTKMAAETVSEPGLPEEITESLEDFDLSLEKVEDVLKPLLESTRDEVRENVSLICWTSAFCTPHCH